MDINEQQNGTTSNLIGPDAANAPITTSAGLAESAFQPVIRVTPDSVQEFRVTVSNPNANQGRSSGAQVTLVTRSGTNGMVLSITSTAIPSRPPTISSITAPTSNGRH